MRGINTWGYRPYKRLYEIEETLLPYICRIAPSKNGFEFEWLDNGCDGTHTVSYRPYRTLHKWITKPVTDRTVVIEGLTEDMEYEFIVRRADGSGESGVRLVRTDDVPGVVVNYLHPEDPIYEWAGHSICSPTLVRLPSGRLVAGMDLYSKNGARNLSLLFKSDDEGRTWRYLTDIFPSFWPKLFVHRDLLYLFSGQSDYGDMLIGRSEDEGETWSSPVHIIPGCGVADMGPHKGPMPIIEHNNRLYTAIDYGAWKYGKHANGMLSIDVDADLLVSENWKYTPFTKYDSSWSNAPIGPCSGCIEGNAVVSPRGHLCNYLRIDHPNAVPNHGKAVILRMDDDPEAPLVLDRIVDCPIGSNSKFQLYQDPLTKKYIAIGNEQGENMPVRTVLSMAVSENFYDWRVVKRIFDYRNTDPMHVAFQYPDWIFSGDDILLLSRTAFGRSWNYHDANYSTFHKIENFRQYL